MDEILCTQKILNEQSDFSGHYTGVVLLPDSDRQYLLTTGLHRIPMTTPLEPENDIRIELSLEVPISFPPDAIFSILPALDRGGSILSAGGWLGYGHSFSAPELFPFSSLFLLPLKRKTGEDFVISASNGLIIALYRAIPLYLEETEMLANTNGAFLENRGQKQADFGKLTLRKSLCDLL
jgi:hypothetical protein